MLYTPTILFHALQVPLDQFFIFIDHLNLWWFSLEQVEWGFVDMKGDVNDHES